MCAISRAEMTCVSRRGSHRRRHHHLHVLRSGRSQGYLMNIRPASARSSATFRHDFSRARRQRVIFSLQRGGNSNLFVMDLRSRDDPVTDTQVIDTAPSYRRRRPLRSSPTAATAADLRDGANGGQAHASASARLLDAGMVPRGATSPSPAECRAGSPSVSCGRMARRRILTELSQRGTGLGRRTDRDHVLPRPGGMRDRRSILWTGRNDSC